MTGIGGSLSRAIMIASQDPGPAVSSPLDAIVDAVDPFWHRDVDVGMKDRFLE
jgi:hypothetical protein